MNYSELQPLWQYAEDCYTGVSAIKSNAKRSNYLFKFNSEKETGSGSQYDMRCKLAEYDNIFRMAVDSITGIMKKQPLKIAFGAGNDTESPQEVRDIEIWATKFNDGITGLRNRLNFAQTLHGRAGLLLDIETDKTGLIPKFVIKEYKAADILDGETACCSGETTLRWVKLNETHNQFDYALKQWKELKQYRILGLDENRRYYSAVLSGIDADMQWLAFNLRKPAGNVVYPQFKGTVLNFIPFTVCNAAKLGLSEFQPPPFIDIAYSAVNAFNADSIHKIAIVNHARPTLVGVNAKGFSKIVLGGTLEVESGDAQKPASVHLLETSGAGLAALAASTAAIKNDALRRTIQGMLEAAGANASGEALLLRTAAGTATIGSIDETGALAIEEQLIFAAMWAGADKKEAGERISVKADTNYMNSKGTVQEFVGLMSANSAAGKPFLSKRNLYAIIESLCPNTLTNFEDNELQIDEEQTYSMDILKGLFDAEADNAQQGKDAD